MIRERCAWLRAADGEVHIGLGKLMRRPVLELSIGLSRPKASISM